MLSGYQFLIGTEFKINCLSRADTHTHAVCPTVAHFLPLPFLLLRYQMSRRSSGSAPNSPRQTLLDQMPASWPYNDHSWGWLHTTEKRPASVWSAVNALNQQPFILGTWLLRESFSPVVTLKGSFWCPTGAFASYLKGLFCGMWVFI